MKLFLVFFLAISFNSFSQTGSLTCDISFIWDDEDSIPVNVILTSQTETFRFYNVFKSDTLNDIKPGSYQAYFYCCDSTSMHGEVIEIEEGMITDVYYYDNFNYDVDRSNTIDSSGVENNFVLLEYGFPQDGDFYLAREQVYEKWNIQFKRVAPGSVDQQLEDSVSDNNKEIYRQIATVYFFAFSCRRFFNFY